MGLDELFGLGVALHEPGDEHADAAEGDDREHADAEDGRPRRAAEVRLHRGVELVADAVPEPVLLRDKRLTHREKGGGVEGRK